MGLPGASSAQVLYRCGKAARTKCFGNRGLLQSHKHTAVCSRAAVSVLQPDGCQHPWWQKGPSELVAKGPWLALNNKTPPMAPPHQMENMFVFPSASHSQDMPQPWTIPWRRMRASSCPLSPFPRGKSRSGSHCLWSAASWGLSPTDIPFCGAATAFDGVYGPWELECCEDYRIRGNTRSKAFDRHILAIILGKHRDFHPSHKFAWVYWLQSQDHIWAWAPPVPAHPLSTPNASPGVTYPFLFTSTIIAI